MENNETPVVETAVEAAPAREERAPRAEGARDFKRKPRKKVCQFCADPNAVIDYKDTAKLRKYLSERSKILPRRTTGACAYHQRLLTEAIKRSRQVALIPYVTD